MFFGISFVGVGDADDDAIEADASVDLDFDDDTIEADAGAGEDASEHGMIVDGDGEERQRFGYRIM